MIYTVKDYREAAITFVREIAAKGSNHDRHELVDTAMFLQSIGVIDLIGKRGEAIDKLREIWRIVSSPIPWDDALDTQCFCEFSHDTDYVSDVESCHYLRRCQSCRGTWYSLKCPHTLNQRPCHHCGVVPTPIEETT